MDTFRIDVAFAPIYATPYRGRSLFVEAHVFLELLVELPSRCVLEDQVHPLLVVEITIQA